MSSRPSDAVAVAVRTGAPLFVADDLMDTEGIMLAVDEEDEDEDARGRGEPEPRRAGGRVPAVPRHHPPGGLLLLSRPPRTATAERPVSRPSGRARRDGGGRVLMTGRAGRRPARPAVRPPATTTSTRPRPPPTGRSGTDHRPPRPRRPRRPTGSGRAGLPDAPPQLSGIGRPVAAARPAPSRSPWPCRNTGRRRCVLAGYPGLQLLDGPGGDPAHHRGARRALQLHHLGPATVTLAAGHGLLQHRLLGRAVGDRDEVPDLGALEITPPDATDHLTVAATCPVRRRHPGGVPGVRRRPAPDSQSTAPPVRLDRQTGRAGPASGPGPARPGCARGPAPAPSRPTSSSTMPSRSVRAARRRPSAPRRPGARRSG